MRAVLCWRRPNGGFRARIFRARIFTLIVDKSSDALKTQTRDFGRPIKGRDILAALALVIADDLVRKAGVDRKLATRAAAHIAEPGEWLKIF